VAWEWRKAAGWAVAGERSAAGGRRWRWRRRRVDEASLAAAARRAMAIQAVEEKGKAATDGEQRGVPGRWAASGPIEMGFEYQ
jgi:hypothetical protein